MEQADLVELPRDAQVLLQVLLGQAVEDPTVNPLRLELQRVLAQAQVIQPGPGHPAVLQITCLGVDAIGDQI